MVLPTANLPLFLTTAIVLAVLPGPGIFYVATRTLAGGRAEGLASSLGTALGGFVHVVAGAVGVSALVLASATLFGWLKLVGAAYLLWLGFSVVRSARRDAATLVAALEQPAGAGTRRAFFDGIVVEALNPKTAAFFLALLPQFVDPGRGHTALQFILLGAVSVALNTAADVAASFAASAVRNALALRPDLVRRLRQASGLALIGLGAGLLFTRRPLPA